MQETQQNFSLANADPDATLVQPRFDEAEAQTARPVVPLSRVAAWRRQTLPVALVVVSALLGGLVSVAAYRLYQRQESAQARTAPPAAAQQRQPATQETQTAQAAPSRASDDTAPAAEAQPAERRQIAADAAKDEERGARSEASDAKPEGAEGRAASKRADEKRAAPPADENAPPTRKGAPRARRVDVITSPYATERDRRRDDDATDQVLPEQHGDKRQRRPKPRNIDRIRDIFGAPPPSN